MVSCTGCRGRLLVFGKARLVHQGGGSGGRVGNEVRAVGHSVLGGRNHSSGDVQARGAGARGAAVLLLGLVAVLVVLVLR
jgi:hypothetical protein